MQIVSRAVRWLAYLHPIAMLAVLALGMLALLEGLQIRQRRALRRPYAAKRHLRFGKSFVVLASLGFASGLGSMLFVRGATVFGSVHAWLASAALVALLAGAVLGHRLELGAAMNVRTAHMLAACVGLLAAFAAAVAGFAILP